MNRIDRVVLARIGSNVLLVAVVVLGISALIDSLNVNRFTTLAGNGGILVALASVVGSALRTVVDNLGFLVLIGAIVGLLNLQANREMTVIRASGISVWRTMRGPLLAAIVLGLLVSVLGDTGLVLLNRSIAPAALKTQTGDPDPLWIEEREAGKHYILEANFVDPGGQSLSGVVVFMLDAPRIRLEAEKADLVKGEWVMPTATQFRSNARPEPVKDIHLPTSSTRSDMRARLASVADMTVFELINSLAGRLTDSKERASTLSRLLKLLSLPLTLCGSVVIAFAFTAGYRRTNKYGASVLYGIVLGFVVYILAEMASRAAFAGAMNPVVAVVGPSLIALVAGATVLLNREDGRT